MPPHGGSTPAVGGSASTTRTPKMTGQVGATDRGGGIRTAIRERIATSRRCSTMPRRKLIQSQATTRLTYSEHADREGTDGATSERTGLPGCVPAGARLRIQRRADTAPGG